MVQTFHITAPPPGRFHSLLLSPDGQAWFCLLGKGGCRRDKREGDGATPVGTFPLRRLFYRPDRWPPGFPPGRLPAIAIGETDRWCDDPGHDDYNRRVQAPHPGRCETLWRQDGLYDALIELGYNDDPPRPGLGSAIFLHLARPEETPTEGCLALRRPDFLALIRLAAAGDMVCISPEETGISS